MLRLSLKYRIALILAGFAVITFGLALMLVSTTSRMEEQLASVTEEGLTATDAADRILAARAASQAQAVKLRIIAVAAIFITAGLSLLLFLVFVYQIVVPLRRLTAEAYREGGPARTGNEVKTLSRRVRVLLHDVDQSHSELEKSRETLAQTEKLALVGTLAASMAHSIRNPFTSVQMRLFSLSRSLDLDDAQKEDLEVIAAEIRRIDTIVQNFLEFSRPPKLKMQPISPSSVVDSAIGLLEHRLKSYDVTVRVNRLKPLPHVSADSEQLKEVLVNIIVNACEAMSRGGSISIAESAEDHPLLKQVAVIRIHDNGPGIDAAILSKVFQPFFSTKADGTGLGLSIAQRIISEHGGRLEVISNSGEGAEFIITLPIEGL
ncbi:MAG TPA: ATP-binding protein [Desulfobacterales bacterium]|nr:ATP-binding protein [Desulfobacterales bacterium]